MCSGSEEGSYLRLIECSTFSPGGQFLMSEVPMYYAGTGVPRPRDTEMCSTFSPEVCSGSEAGSYLRLTDSCITQRKAQGPSRTCNESKEEEAAISPAAAARGGDAFNALILKMAQVKARIWR